MLTRYSLSLISFGTPICMVVFRRRRGALPRGSVGVDLGLLQPAGVVDVDRLPFREDLESRLGRPFTMSIARAARAPERQVRLGADGRRVDVGDAGLEVARRLKRAVDVLRIDRG